MFKCGICGKEFDTIEGRMKCEQKCYAEHILEQERQKEEKRKAEEELKKSKKNGRIKELQQEYKNFLNNVEQFNKDYGEQFKIDEKYSDFFNDSLLSSFMLDPFEEWLNGRF